MEQEQEFHESPFPEPPFPGFDQYDGELRYSTHAVKDRMLKDGHTDTDVRMVLAHPDSIRRSRNPKHPTRFVVEGVCGLGVNLRVVLDHDALHHEFLWVASVFATDVKPVRIKVPARSVWRVWAVLDRLKATANVDMSKPNGKGNATVTIIDAMPSLRDDAVRMVESIISDER